MEEQKPSSRLCFLRRTWWVVTSWLKTKNPNKKAEKADKETFSLKEGTFQGCVTSFIFSSEILEAVPVYQEEKDVEHPVFSQKPVTDVLVDTIRKERWLIRGILWRKNKNSFYFKFETEFHYELMAGLKLSMQSRLFLNLEISLSLFRVKGVHHHSCPRTKFLLFICRKYGGLKRQDCHICSIRVDQDGCG